MKIKKITEDNIDIITSEINAALKGICKEYGVEISLGNVSYDYSQFSTKLTVKSLGVPSREETDYINNRALYNLPALNTSFSTSANEKFTIIGWNRRARKNKILLKKEGDTAAYYCSIDMLQKQQKCELSAVA